MKNGQSLKLDSPSGIGDLRWLLVILFRKFGLHADKDF